MLVPEVRNLSATSAAPKQHECSVSAAAAKDDGSDPAET
jgi:hypothetical protein